MNNYTVDVNQSFPSYAVTLSRNITGTQTHNVIRSECARNSPMFSDECLGIAWNGQECNKCISSVVYSSIFCSSIDYTDYSLTTGQGLYNLATE